MRLKSSLRRVYSNSCLYAALVYGIEILEF